MSYSPPTPPEEFPAVIIETLDGYSLEFLRCAAEYAERLGEYREREKRLAEQEKKQGDQNEEQPADLPDDVPSKATITVMEINDNRYYYWQWRDGGKIRSKYKVQSIQAARGYQDWIHFACIPFEVHRVRRHDCRSFLRQPLSR